MHCLFPIFLYTQHCHQLCYKTIAFPASKLNEWILTELIVLTVEYIQGRQSGVNFLIFYVLCSISVCLVFLSHDCLSASLQCPRVHKIFFVLSVSQLTEIKDWMIYILYRFLEVSCDLIMWVQRMNVLLEQTSLSCTG